VFIKKGGGSGVLLSLGGQASGAAQLAHAREYEIAGRYSEY